MKLHQYQRDALLLLRTMLNPDDPQNTTTDENKAHLRAMQPWLSSSVHQAIDTVDSPKDYEHRWMREATSEKARRIRLAQGRGAHAPDPWPTDHKERKR